MQSQKSPSNSDGKPPKQNSHSRVADYTIAGGSVSFRFALLVVGVHPLLGGGGVLKIYMVPSFSPIQFFQRTL